MPVFGKECLPLRQENALVSWLCLTKPQTTRVPRVQNVSSQNCLSEDKWCLVPLSWSVSCLKALDTIGNYSKYMRVEQLRPVGSIKHCQKRLPLKYLVFEKEVISYQSIWIKFETLAEVSNSSIWKYTTCATRVFMFHCSLETLTTNWVQIYTG